MRRAYDEIDDGENEQIEAVLALIRKACKQRLHVELDEEVPCFTEGSKPEDLVRVSTALISKKDSTESDWGAALVRIIDPGYVVATDLEHINDEPKRIKAKSQCSTLEQYLLPKAIWAKRITIIDPYAMARENNRAGILRFLDFLSRESTNLKQIRFVFGEHYSEEVLHTDENGIQNKTKNDIRGEPARIKILQLFRENVLHHDIFKKVELIQIAWKAGLSKRYLSFGSDSKEITIPFDKGVSEHFRVGRNDKLARDIDLGQQYDQVMSEETVRFDYEVIQV